MGKRKKPREYKASARVKMRSAKVMDRLTFCPNKHKQKVTRKLRQELQMKRVSTERPPPPKSVLKFGSFNVNGLDLETSWAVGQLLQDNEFDVRYIFLVI